MYQILLINYLKEGNEVTYTHMVDNATFMLYDVGENAKMCFFCKYLEK